MDSKQQKRRQQFGLGLTAENIETLKLVQTYASLIRNVDIEAVRELKTRLEHFENIAPVLLPGDYMEVMDTLPGYLEFIEEFLAFRAYIEGLHEDFIASEQ